MSRQAERGKGRVMERDYASLFFKLCDCAGAQPSINNSRADEHAVECPYRAAIKLWCDEDGVPFGWEHVTLTEEELDELCEFADRGLIEQAEHVVEGAYGRLHERLFGEHVN